jgi:hypothetical protein
VLLAALSTSPGPFIALTLLGFLVGIGGHIYKSNSAIAIGIGMVFLGTVVLPGIVFLDQP